MTRAAWRSITASASRGCAATIAGTPRLRMPAFSAAIFAERVAEMLGMIERDRRDHGGERALDHVGGIEPAAEPDFEQQHVGRMAREQQEARRGRDLEHGDRRAGIDALAFGERAASSSSDDQPAFALRAEPEALVEAHEMRRGVDVHAQSPAASRIARMKAMVEPLPLVPATWMTGGSSRSG